MDKREIAANLILRSIKSYVQAEMDMDYIQSILLAGASLGLTEPLLKESKTKSASDKAAETVIAIKEANFKWEGNRLVVEKSVRVLGRKKRDEIIKRVRIADREVYNSLKHTGKHWDNTSASNDLKIEADFQETAENIIFDAIDDFNSLKFDDSFQYHSLPSEIIYLLNCGDPMESLPKFHCKERRHS
jgi:hypothetical protein